MGNGPSGHAHTAAEARARGRSDSDMALPAENVMSTSSEATQRDVDTSREAKVDEDTPPHPQSASSATDTTGDAPEPLQVTAPQLHALRSALRERLQDDMLNQYAFMGDRECVATLVSLFERTVTSGQNQSGLLIGSAGFGQKQIVASALRELRARCEGTRAGGSAAFTHVYLNGTILQNEIEAFKEMLAQLSHDTSIKHPVLSYSSMYTYLRSLLRAKAEANTPVLVILDGLEHFAHKTSAKQLLLYNLLDWLQFKDVQMGVLGVTEDFCIMDSLEKRVRSRFSKLQVVVPVRSFETMKTMLRDAFTLRTIDWERMGVKTPPSQQFIAAFDARVDALFTQNDEFAGFRILFERLWDSSRSPAYFVRLAVSAASFLTQDRALLSPFHFQRALHLLEPDYQLATLRGISDHGIALLIGMSHLENDGHTFFTLEMVYRKWQDFFRKHDMLKSLPTRTEAQRELEILIELQLVEDAGDPFRISRVKHAPANFLQPEYRAVHLNLEPKILQTLIRNGSIQCSTAMTEWMVNGS